MMIRDGSQRGSILLEALIALLLLGAGFVAYVQLHGKMTSSVSASKARAEAMQIAQQRSQSLRVYIASGQFNDDLSNQAWSACEAGINPIPGVNASFTEECRIVDATGGKYKEAMVRVTWADEAGVSQQVSLNNYIRFSNPVLSALLSEKEIVINSPLTRRNRWGDERVEDGTGDEGPSRLAGSEIAVTADLTGIDLYKQYNLKGNWELLGSTGNTNGIVLLTAYGGILHEIHGAVYFRDTNMNANDVGNLEILATSPSHCEIESCNNSGGTDASACMSEARGYKLSYTCWVPGDCTNEASYNADGTYVTGSYTNNGYNTDCAPPAGITEADHFERIKSLDLAGGWYGRVGVFGVQENPFDDIVTGDSCDSPSRNYVALRLNSVAPPTPPDSCNDPLYIDTADADADYVVPDNTEFVSTNPGYIYDSVNTALVKGYCTEAARTPHAIYLNEGINTSYSVHQNFWLVDKDVKADVCPKIVQNAWCEDATDSSDPHGIGLMPSNVVRTLIDLASSSVNVIRDDNYISGISGDVLLSDSSYEDLVPITKICPPGP